MYAHLFNTSWECSVVFVCREICGVSPEEEKVGYGGKDLQKTKVLSLEWKCEGVMDDESGELMELVEKCHSKHWVMQKWRD